MKKKKKTFPPQKKEQGERNYFVRDAKFLKGGFEVEGVEDADIVPGRPTLALDDGLVHEVGEHVPVVADEERMPHEGKLLRVLVG